MLRLKKIFKYIDKPLLFLIIIFSLFGLIMIFSASSVSTVLRYHVSTSHFFLRQALFLFVSFAFGLFLLLYPTSHYKRTIPIFVVAVIVALAGLFLYDKIVNGAQSWYDLKFFSLQPSEFAKSILIIFMAVFYDIIQKKNTQNIYLYLFPVAVGIVMATLVLMQPDFGSAFIILGILFLTFLSVPNVKSNLIKILKVVGIGVVIVVIGLLYSGNKLLNDEQLGRLNFQKPCTRYTEKSGYQVCNSLIAMKNGCLFGVGLGKSTQKFLYLPESHTDFIFPIIVEELGYIAGVLIILGYGYMLLRILKIAKEAGTLRCSILAYGTFWYLLLHILINILGVLALIPLTGVPLPLLSYGGSFTVNIVIMLFITLRCSIENKENQIKKELSKI